MAGPFTAAIRGGEAPDGPVEPVAGAPQLGHEGLVPGGLVELLEVETSREDSARTSQDHSLYLWIRRQRVKGVAYGVA